MIDSNMHTPAEVILKSLKDIEDKVRTCTIRGAAGVFHYIKEDIQEMWDVPNN